MGEDHEEDIEDPDDVPSEDQTNQSADPMPFAETSNESEYPRSDGDDAEDQTDNPIQAKIIFADAFCHNNDFLSRKMIPFPKENLNGLCKKKPCE